MTEVQHLPNHPACPTCKRSLRFYLVLVGEERDPQRGDVSVCAECGEMLVYDAPYRIRRMELMEELNLQPGVWALMQGQRMAILREKST